MSEMPSLTRYAQGALILAAFLVAGWIVSGDDAPPAPQSAPPGETVLEQADMLAFLDRQVAAQEDEKDVRCWSSVRKIQMFLAGVAIESDALGVRVEGYVDTIQEVWELAEDRAQGDVISEQELARVLDERFPRTTTEAGVAFHFAGQAEPIVVGTDAVTDYSDTIEAWRLLQTWASRHTEDDGTLTLSPQLSDDALQAFHDFLVVYDIALLRHAKAIAHEHKQSTVDGEAMALAFSGDRQPKKI